MNFTNAEMPYYLETKQQTIDFITNVVNAHKPKEITPDSMKYWIVSYCELSKRKDYWLVYGNSRECVLYDRNCLVGLWGFAIDRTTAEVFSCCIESPETFVQRQYDKADANGKFYALKPNFERNAKSIILIKQKLGITLSQARFIMDNIPIWLVAEKIELMEIQALCESNDIKLDLVLIDQTPPQTFSDDISAGCLIWFEHFRRHIQNGLKIWNIR